jgi:hypothetical protein
MTEGRHDRGAQCKERKRTRDCPPRGGRFRVRRRVSELPDGQEKGR